MFPAFSIALSALDANSTAIDVVGNNLANLNTTGYKDTTVNFSDLISQSLGVGGTSSSQVGMGVGPVSTVANYIQGTVTNTQGPTDAAIEGSGFFVVQNASNQTLYTRDGSFQVDGNGNLVTATGEKVQGWNAVNGVVNANGPVSNLSVPLGTTVPATATTTMSVNVNLNASVATTDPGAVFAAPIQVVDSQGATHTLTATFTKTATNSWSYAVTIPAADLSSGGTTTLTSGKLTFDANGNITSPAASTDPQTVKVTGLADGAADLNIGWNLHDSSGNSLITQLAEASSVGAIKQNGEPAGQIVSVSLQNGGIVMADYSNGQQSVVGQLAVASIPNPESLTSVGNNNLETTFTTGSVSVGAPGTTGRGQIVAGALESSTVDIASEFTKLLTYERSYQAASRVITASDQLMQETVNLIHP
jgi:flagellar hook protein FlgE